MLVRQRIKGAEFVQIVPKRLNRLNKRVDCAREQRVYLRDREGRPEIDLEHNIPLVV